MKKLCIDCGKKISVGSKSGFCSSCSRKGSRNKMYGRSRSGSNNPMFGRTILEVWIEKYGLSKANDMWLDRNNKMSKTRIKKGTFKKEKNPMYNKESWCKGLTKQSDDRVLNASIKLSNTRKKMFKEGRLVIDVPHCDTKPEIEIELILENIGIKYKKQKRLYYDNNKYKIYDFYLTDLNTLLEVDGAYWHCRLDKKPNNYVEIVKNDLFKNELAEKNGFRLIRVWDDEIDFVWRNIKD